MESRRPIVRLLDSLYYSSRAGGSFLRLVPNELFKEGEYLFPHEVDERLGIKQPIYIPPKQETQVVTQPPRPLPVAPPKEEEGELVSMEDLNSLLDSFN